MFKKLFSIPSASSLNNNPTCKVLTKKEAKKGIFEAHKRGYRIWSFENRIIDDKLLDELTKKGYFVLEEIGPCGIPMVTVER